MLEKTVRMSLLYDFYGQLLTERQREFFALYYDNDLSLGEIAEQYGVSRQAVYDILRRSAETLTGLEAKLELVERHERQRRAVEHIERELLSIEESLADPDASVSVPERLAGVRSVLETLK